MNLGSTNVVLRPRSTLESVDLSLLFLVRLGGRRYLGLCALLLLPALALCVLCRFAFEWSWPALWLVAVPLGLWLQGVFTLAAGDLMFSEQLEPRGVLRRFWAASGGYTAMMFFTRAGMALAASTLVLWPWAWMRYTFLPEALLLEGLPTWRASARAARLMEGNAGQRFALFVITLLMFLAGVYAAQVLGEAVVHDTLQLRLPWGDLLSDGGSLYALAGWFAAVPVLTTLRFLRYVDARTRADAWDVQVRLQRAARLLEVA
ncbi:MAG TPA: hypothetical protein VFS67_02925 [Polyangiaceae bacterium]|nr:hypothetical protein [Polyangiaceae bacterium]